MTDLLDRYLAAVSRALPVEQRADIVAELRDELLTKVELREEAAGRPLDRDEMEAVLLEFGHPLIVAGRYRSVQHLVGPEIFPLWWAALKVTLAIIAAIYIVAAAVGIAFVDGRLPDHQLPGLVTALVTAFGAVTLTAVVIERLNLQRFVYRWRPRQLPAAGAKAKSPFERMVELAMGAVFVLWWTGVIHFRDWIPAFGVLVVNMAPVWAAYFWPILVYALYEIVMHLIALARPGWARVNAGLALVRVLAGTVIVAHILRGADSWLTVSSSALGPEALASAQAGFDSGMRLGLAATVAIFVILDVVEAWRLWQAMRAVAGPASARAPETVR